MEDFSFLLDLVKDFPALALLFYGFWIIDKHMTAFQIMLQDHLDDLVQIVGAFVIERIMENQETNQHEYIRNRGQQRTSHRGFSGVWRNRRGRDP